MGAGEGETGKEGTDWLAAACLWEVHTALIGLLAGADTSCSCLREMLTWPWGSQAGRGRQGRKQTDFNLSSPFHSLSTAFPQQP